MEDARATYAAIRLAAPGGLQDKVESQDVRDEPTVTLREAMAHAVERDSIASEYLSDYTITFERGLPALKSTREAGLDEREAVVQVYLQLLATVPDTLIARKQGRAAAEAVSHQAAGVLATGGVTTEVGRHEIAALDRSLRDPDNRMNPGTTADLVAATLFVDMLEEAHIQNK
jgi:triphosphoribosyl-dephospho-CoA synthase